MKGVRALKKTRKISKNSEHSIFFTAEDGPPKKSRKSASLKGAEGAPEDGLGELAGGHAVLVQDHIALHVAVPHVAQDFHLLGGRYGLCS